MRRLLLRVYFLAECAPNSFADAATNGDTDSFADFRSESFADTATDGDTDNFADD